MKRLLVCGVAFGALMTQAIAADMFVKAAPPAPAWSWTGFYIGGNAGYAWGDTTDPAISFVDPGGVIGFAGYFNAGGNVFQSLNQGGFVGGGQVGYDWQFNQWGVIGVVADYQGANVTDSQSASITPPGFVTSTQLLSAKIDSHGTGSLGRDRLQRALLWHRRFGLRSCGEHPRLFRACFAVVFHRDHYFPKQDRLGRWARCELRFDAELERRGRMAPLRSWQLNCNRSYSCTRPNRARGQSYGIAEHYRRSCSREPQL